MYTIEPGPFTLTCHPQTTSQEVREIDVVVEEAKNGSLMLTFCLVGDITGLAIPGPRSPRSDIWGQSKNYSKASLTTTLFLL